MIQTRQVDGMEAKLIIQLSVIKSTKTQLIQSEKMASLSEPTA
ncbi:MAG: hypothetical protein U5K79_18195 [Cyclobacteriaceae bacterium]|nr:hypothetical protein [Cyclobacteriaceae bacterium]